MASPGRPIKRKADYFAHRADSSSDRRIEYIESVFGHLGYSFIFKMLEQLTLSPDFQIELNEIEKRILYRKFSISNEQFEKLLYECTRAEVKLFTVENGVIFSEELKESMKPLLAKRMRDREYIIASDNSTNPNIIVSDNLLSKEKESKEELEKKSKVIEDHFFYSTAKNLFKNKTKIENPSIEKHIIPILDYFETIPENLTNSDIEICIKESFEGLSHLPGIRMDFLTNNISQKIAAKREAVYNSAKQSILSEAEKMRKDAVKAEVEAKQLDVVEKIADLKKQFETQLNRFTAKEKTEIKSAFERSDWVWAEGIIGSKLEEHDNRIMEHEPSL